MRCSLGFLILCMLVSGCAFSERANASQNKRSKDCLSLAMYWEARGEGAVGMAAVGAVVLNRVEDDRFPNSVCGVIFEGGEHPPCQFSWWCDGQSDKPTNRKQWQAAVRVADTLLRRDFRDPTRGALYFHSTSVRSNWHATRKRTTQIGNHIFYR